MAIYFVSDFDNSTRDLCLRGHLEAGNFGAAGSVSLPEYTVRRENSGHTRANGETARTKVTSDVARDLCQRAGAKAYVTGAIGSLGSQYVIGLNAVNCKTGDPLVQEQATADDKEPRPLGAGRNGDQASREVGSASTKMPRRRQARWSEDDSSFSTGT
jgi:hypothetical protein